MVCYAALERLVRGAGGGAIHNTLLKGLKDLVSSDPIVALWDLSRLALADRALAHLFETESPALILGKLGQFPAFQAAFSQFLRQYGFRRSGELMLTEPSFEENPVEVIALVKAYVPLRGPSPHEVVGAEGDARRDETHAVMHALGAKRHVAKVVLFWTQRSIAMRERARMKQALLYTRLRQVVLTMGDRLTAAGVIADRGDIFFLTHQEIESLVAGSAMFPYGVRDLIALRRRQHADLCRMSPADVVRLRPGAYLESTPTDASPVAASAPEVSLARELQGVGTCGGMVTARAAVLADMSEAQRLTAGDILVTRQTDPGWGPIFFLIKGLVMERGGMLSHGAILAREFGIPAVVGIKGATVAIAHGARISVDGDRGHVRQGG